MRGKRTGRLLRYDPTTDTVEVLARSLHFPNGVAVDKDETYVFFAETFTLRLLKYSILDGVVDVAVDGDLTGYVDGVDCTWPGVTSESSSHCYAVMPSAMIPVMKFVQTVPHPWDMVLRTILLGLPKSLAPPVKPYGGIVEIHVENGNSIRFIQDPDGADIGMLTGVTVFDNKLYLGSLRNNFIGVYEL
jgi:hypothetical protein